MAGEAPICKLCGKKLSKVIPADECGTDDPPPTAGWETNFVDPEDFTVAPGYVCGACHDDYLAQLGQA